MLIKTSANLEPLWSVATTHLATTHSEAFIASAWKDIEPQTTTRHSFPMTAPFVQTWMSVPFLACAGVEDGV